MKLMKKRIAALSTRNFYQPYCITIIASRLKHKDGSADYNCRLCGEHFDSFGDMQRHELIKHVQGDIANQSEK
jgi:hypothetical protein